MKENLEIYKIIDYMGKREYLFCLHADRYFLVGDFSWGVVGNHWISSSQPLQFIRDRHGDFNSKTTTGINEIRRIQFENVPKLVRRLFDESEGA